LLPGKRDREFKEKNDKAFFALTTLMTGIQASVKLKVRGSAMKYYLGLAILLFASSCGRSSSQTWEDFKTAGRYMHRGLDAVFGKDYESRLLTSDEEFLGPYEDEFIPLSDTDLRASGVDLAIPQPKGTPGQKGIPLLSDYYAAPNSLRAYFKAVHFETDDHVVKDKHDIEQLNELASYLKSHPNVFLFVEGHCDERASASYNMALGMRRANFIRSFLVKRGVNLNRVYTASRGKEQPVALGHSLDDWKINRRSEFKIYEK